MMEESEGFCKKFVVLHVAETGMFSAIMGEWGKGRPVFRGGTGRG